MSGVESDMETAIGGAGQLTAQEAIAAVNAGIMANIDQLSGAIAALVKAITSGLAAQAPQLTTTGQQIYCVANTAF